MRSLIAVLLLAVLSFSAPAQADEPSTTGAAEVTSALVSQAREVPPFQPVVALPPATPSDVDFTSVTKLVVEALGSKNWSLLACAGVLAVVYLGRRIGAGFWPWLRSDAGGVVLSFTTAVLLTLASALSTGTPFSLSLLVGAILTAAGASGFWTWGKKLTKKPAVTGADLSR